MYSPTDLTQNVLITLDGQPYKVVECHKRRWSVDSIVKVKVKNLITGALLPKTFKEHEKIEPAKVVTKKVGFLYRDELHFYFMDFESFVQYELNVDMADHLKDHIKDGDIVELQLYNGIPIDLVLPKNYSESKK